MLVVSDEDRDAILRRRRRFVNLTLAGLASASLVGCGDDSTPPTPCLSPDCPPEVCFPLDAGTDGGSDAGETDAGSVVIQDAGSDDVDAATTDDDAG